MTPNPAQAPCPRCGQLWFAGSANPLQPPKCPKCLVPLTLPGAQPPAPQNPVAVGDWGEEPAPAGFASPQYAPPPPYYPPQQFEQPPEEEVVLQPVPEPRRPQPPKTSRQPAYAPRTATRQAEPPASNKKGILLLAGMVVVGAAVGGAVLLLSGDKPQPDQAKHSAKKDDTTEKHPDDTNTEPTPAPVKPKLVPPELLPEASLAERTPEEITNNSILILKSGLLAQRVVAAQRLATLQAQASAAVPALIGALDTPDAKLQAAIGEALVKIGPPNSGSGGERVLLPALRSKSPQARSYAAKLLAAEPMLTSESVKPLAAGLKDEQPDVRANCAQALGKLGVKAQPAFEPLLDLLLDTNEAASQAAAEALPLLGAPSASLRPVLVAKVAHNDVRMRLATAPLLAALGTKDPDTLQVWRPLLKDSEPKLRLIALNALSPSMELVVEAGPDILRLLSDKDAAVRKAAAHCAVHLGKVIGAPTAIASGFADETDPAVKLELASCLIAIVKPDITNLKAFRLVLKEGTPEQRELAAKAIATMGRDASDALPELTACLGSEAQPVRVAALKAMAAMGTDSKSSLPAVVALIDKEMTPAPVLAAAVEMLGASGVEGQPHLEKMTKKAMLPDEVKEQMCIAFSQSKFVSEAVQVWLADQSEVLPKSREVIAKTFAKKGSDAIVERLLPRTHFYKAAKGGNPPEMYPTDYRQWVITTFGKMNLKNDVSDETRTKVIDRLKYLSKNDKTPEVVMDANTVLKKLN